MNKQKEINQAPVEPCALPEHDYVSPGFKIPEKIMEISDAIARVVEEVSRYTMTSRESIAFTVASTIETIDADRPGDLVECGTWMGGSSFAMLLAQRYCYGRILRPVWMLDSFQGLPVAQKEDGPLAVEYQRNRDAQGFYDNCTAALEKVTSAIRSFGFTEEECRVVPGWFNESIPTIRPKLSQRGIALLRVDCDWYEPVLYVLNELTPLVAEDGIIILDDYYWWDGCARATHEFLYKNDLTWRIRAIEKVYCAWMIKRAHRRDQQVENELADAQRNISELRRETAALAQRDAALAERDAAEAERDRAKTERDTALAARAAAEAERDRAKTERDDARSERDIALATSRAATIASFTYWISRRPTLADLFRRSIAERRSAFLAKAAAMRLDSRIAEAALPTLCQRRVLFGLSRRPLARRTAVISELLEHMSRHVETATSVPFPSAPVSAVSYRPTLRRAHAGNCGDAQRENVIVAVHEASRTGAPILGWNIARQLAERYNVFTVCLAGGVLMPEFKALSADLYGPFPGLHDEPTALDWELGPLFAGRTFRYAIVNSCESRALVGICKKHDVPTLFLMHEFASYVYHRAALERALRGASKVVFSADIVAQSSREVYPGLAGQCACVLPQGMSVVPASNDSHKPLPSALLGKLASLRSSGGLVVLGAGSVNLRKGVDLFLATASKVKRSGLDRPVHFVWVGGGYCPDKDTGYSIYLREQLQRSGIDDCVMFVDEVSDLNPLYDLTDLFFLASRLDPLPNVTIDAAHRGIPVLCFKDASGMSELMRADPVTAEAVVDYLDTGAAAEFVARFADDDSYRVRLSEAVRQLALVAFDMKRYVEQLDALGRAAGASTDAAQHLASGA